MSFAYALLALNLLASRQLPPGAQLHIRLTTPISSYASHAGDRVDAHSQGALVEQGRVPRKLSRVRAARRGGVAAEAHP